MARFPPCNRITRFQRLCPPDCRCPESAGMATLRSGKKKERKLQLWGPDIFQWSGGLQRKWNGGPKSSVCLSKPRETRLFGGISRHFCWDTPEVPEKSATKRRMCVQALAPVRRHVCGSHGHEEFPEKGKFRKWLGEGATSLWDLSTKPLALHSFKKKGLGGAETLGSCLGPT